MTRAGKILLRVFGDVAGQTGKNKIAVERGRRRAYNDRLDLAGHVLDLIGRTLDAIDINLDPALDRTSEAARRLLQRWGQLHAIRSILALTASVVFYYWCFLRHRSLNPTESCTQEKRSPLVRTKVERGDVAGYGMMTSLRPR